jgi:hypothetical protein
MEYYITTARNLCAEIEHLQQTERDVNTIATRAGKMILNTLKQFRLKIRKEGFTTLDEEIHFFKFIKPKIQSYLIFYSVLQEIELAKLHMSDEDIKALIEKKDRMFRHIIARNLDFVKYYLEGMDHHDNLYFVREPKVSVISRHTSAMLVDPEFNTSHDQVAADILAFELFKKYLAIDKEKHPPMKFPHPKLKWTASKLDLVELIYALHASGVINHGSADLKEIQEAFELIFKCQIDDLYRSFHDIANRKKEQIKFVNLLGENLKNRLDEVNGLG